MSWIWIILALLYILSPYDLLPDFIPLRGWLDDIVVLILAVRYFMRFQKSRQGPQTANDQANRQERAQQADPTNGAPPTDPYMVLGITRTATKEEIQTAYRRLASQYHPDKVAHLGKEFQALAEKRFKEIQAAYEKIVKG